MPAHGQGIKQAREIGGIEMTELVLRTGRMALEWAGIKWPINSWRLLILLFIALLITTSPELRAVTLSSISDAYLQVTVFVAGTLAIVYTFEHAFGFDLGRFMARSRALQAPLASFLGALPGCGGAIIVVTQYTRGLVSFGSVVSVLIATMGDAAFLLIAREPTTGLAIMVLGFTVGTLSGWVVDAIHGQDFMRSDVESDHATTRRFSFNRKSHSSLSKLVASKAWLWLVVPGGVLGILVAFQFESDSLFGPLSGLEPTHWYGAIGGILCLLMWGFSKRENAHARKNIRSRNRHLPISERIIKDTNFVTSWVVMGFLSYELAVHFAGSGIETWLKVWAPFVPLVAILVGFIPGCGPQIVITTLYLSGAIPLSAQLGNAISNDGDALFPALALAPRAAVLATLYSAVPALIVGYAYFFLFE